MNFEIGEPDLSTYQRMLDDSNYKSIFRTPQFLRVWLEGVHGTEMKFLISKNGVIPGIVFKRGPLKAFYSLPYQTFGGPIGEIKKVDFRFPGFSEVSIDDPELKIDVPLMEPVYSSEAVIPLSQNYDKVFSTFSPSRRKIIRRLERENPNYRKINSIKDMDIIYPLYRTFCQSKHIHCFPLKFFKSLFTNLYPRHLYGFLVFKDSSLAGYVINVTGFGRATAFSHAWQDIIPNVSSFLIHLSIKAAAESGNYEYSLGLTGENLQGVYKFKKSFGATFRPFRTYWKRTFYHNLARTLKSGVKRWIKY